jgi:hypothetical protein
MASLIAVEVVPPSPGDSTRHPFEILRGPGGIKLMKEEITPLLLVWLTDDGGRGPQSGQATQKAAVRLMRPPHISTSPPPRATQGIEAPVVPHPVTGVRLDIITG